MHAPRLRLQVLLQGEWQVTTNPKLIALAANCQGQVGWFLDCVYQLSGIVGSSPLHCRVWAAPEGAQDQLDKLAIAMALGFEPEMTTVVATIRGLGWDSILAPL